MSEVHISFLGPMRKPAGLGATADVALPADGTVDALLGELGYEPDERSRLRVMIAGETVPLGTTLQAGQELTIFLPLGGG